MRRLALFAFMTAAVGCGLAFSPGDYEGAPSVHDAAPAADVVVAHDAAVDATAPAPTGHVIVFSASGEVWTATIDPTGDVQSFVYNATNPVSAAVEAASIDDGGLAFATSLPSSRALVTVPFDGGVVTGGYDVTPVGTPNSPGHGQFFAGSALVAVGGADDTTYDRTVSVVGPDGGVSVSATELPIGIAQVVVANDGPFVFLNGIGADADQGSKIYVGMRDPVLGATGFVETTPLPVDAAHPMFCAGSGRLFVAGGTDGSTAVFSAPIDATTGAVGTWAPGPDLPTPLRLAGCFIFQNALYLAGGYTGGGDAGPIVATAQVLRSRVAPDGTMAVWELSAGQPLPAPRANVLALTY